MLQAVATAELAREGQQDGEFEVVNVSRLQKVEMQEYSVIPTEVYRQAKKAS